MAFSPGSLLGNANMRVGVDTSSMRGQMRHGINGMKQEMDRGAKEVSASSKRWASAFGMIGAAAKVGMLGIVTAVGIGVGAAIQFESAWAGVRKTVDATPEQLAALKQQFRDLAKEIPVSVNELAKIGETAGALGIPRDNILEFVKVVSTIGQTTNVSTDQAATSLGQLGNVLKLQREDYSRFAATLVDLGNKGASTEAQILEIASRAGAAGGTIGLTTREVLAFASATANMGIEVEAGGSSLQNFWLKMNMIVGAGSGLTKIAKQAGVSVEKLKDIIGGGGKNLNALAKSLGMTNTQLKDMVTKAGGLELVAKTAGTTGEAFADAFGKKAGPAIVSFLEGLAKVAPAERQGILAGLKMSDIRITRMLLGFAASTDNLTNSLAVSEAAWNANTAATDEAAKRYETTASQIGLLKNILQDYVITLGDKALPAVKEFVTFLRETLPRALDFISQVWKTTLEPVVTTLLTAFGKLGVSIGKIFGNSEETANWGGVAKTAFQGVANALAQIGTFIAIVVDGLAAILDNPIAQWAARVIGGLLLVKVALSGILFLVNKLNRASLGLLGGAAGAGRGLVNMLTLGKYGKSTPAVAATSAVDASSAKLAKAGDTAATKIVAGATQAGRILGTAGAGRGVAGAMGGGRAPIGRAPIAYPQQFMGPSTQLGSPAALAAQAKFAAMSPMEQQALTNAAQPMSKTGLRAGLIKAGSTVLSGAAKVFWPLLIADLAIEFLKAPIGDFISENTQFKRAGAKIKEDFFGGLVSLVESWGQGSDLKVGVETATGGSPDFNIAGKKINAGALGNLNMPDEEIAALVNPTLANRGLDMWAYSEAEAVGKKLRQASNETVDQWANRVLPELTRNGVDVSQIEAILKDRKNRTSGGTSGQPSGLKPGAAAQITELMSARVEAFATALDTDAKEALRMGVIQAISLTTKGKVGLTRLMKLTPEQIRLLGQQYGAVAAGAMDPRAAALALGGMLTPPKAAPKTTKVLQYTDKYGRRDPNAPGFQPSVRAGEVALQRRNIADYAEGEAARVRGLAPDDKAAYNFAEQYMGSVAKQVRAAGKDPKKQKVVLDAINDLMVKAGQAKFADWGAVLAFTDEQKNLSGAPIRAQIAAAMKEWSVGAAQIADPEGIKVFMAKWGPAITAADTTKEKAALLKKLNALLPEEAQLKDVKAMEKWLNSVMVQAAATGDPASVKQFLATWGTQIEAADTSTEKTILRRKLNDLLPKGAQLEDNAAFDAWLKGVMTPPAEGEKSPVTSFFETMFSQGPAAAVGTLTSSLQGAAQEAAGMVMDDPTVAAYAAAGGKLVDALAGGIRAQTAVTKVRNAINSVLKSLGLSLPGSPVRSGPFKHPYLPNAGKAIVGQIGAGIKAAALPFPNIAPTPRLTPSPAMAGTAGGGKGQSIYIDRMSLYNARDEQDVVQRLAFLMPNGR